MSMDKYPSIFSRQMETIVYLFNNVLLTSDVQDLWILDEEVTNSLE